MQSSTTPFTHPSIGDLTYLHDNEVAQFYLPFATIPGRFRQSKLIDKNLGTLDCTKPGPLCSQIPISDSSPFGYLPSPSVPTYDELNCLHLAISAPISALGTSKLLPVMVYVHGGANVMGTGTNSGKTNSVNLVKRSMKEGKDVVIVSISYRLHYIGFLASKDLIQYGAAHGEAPCNYGLFDTRNAFLWVRKNIAAFGGNPNQVTAFGESAGSIIIAQQMCSGEPGLFRRAILQSGMACTLALAPVEAHEAGYRRVFESLELPYDGVSAEERVQSLIDVPIEEFIKLIKKGGSTVASFFPPLQDQSFFPIPVTEETEGEILSKCDWVDEVILGDAIYEGVIFAGNTAPPKANFQTFQTLCTNLYGADVTQKIFEAYRITPALSPVNFMHAAAAFIGDLMFSNLHDKVLKTITANSTKPVYAYHFAQPNPFLGSPLYGHAHHGMDVIHIFQNFIPHFDSDIDRLTSVEVGQAWVRFANGEAPWTEYSDGDGQTVAIIRDGIKEWKRRDDPYSRHKCWDLLQELGVKNSPLARHIALMLPPAPQARAS